LSLKKQLKRLVLAMVLLTIVLVLAEAAIRVLNHRKGHKNTVVADERLGWVFNEEVGEQAYENRCGEKVSRKAPIDPVLIQHSQENRKFRVLFIGDSYTRALQVSTGHAYYDVFENSQELFSESAAGVSGYGPYQEYLMLEDVIERVQPEIVVWQLSNNDLSNSVVELDQRSILGSPLQSRPFLDPESGESHMKKGGGLLRSLLTVSFVSRRLFRVVILVDRRWRLGVISWLDEDLTKEQVISAEEKGLRVLETLLSRAKRDYPNVLFVGFCVSEDNDSRYQNIFEAQGFKYISGVGQHVCQFEGTNCLPSDNHWNHLGHEIAGEYLASELEPAAADWLKSIVTK
jgi:hypothetical protein